MSLIYQVYIKRDICLSNVWSPWLCFRNGASGVTRLSGSGVLSDFIGFNVIFKVYGNCVNVPTGGGRYVLVHVPIGIILDNLWGHCSRPLGRKYVCRVCNLHSVYVSSVFGPVSNRY